MARQTGRGAYRARSVSPNRKAGSCRSLPGTRQRARVGSCISSVPEAQHSWQPGQIVTFTTAVADYTGVMEQAPDFSLPDQNGGVKTLADYAGTWLVLYFYPKDDTPGCTTEACSF